MQKTTGLQRSTPTGQRTSVDLPAESALPTSSMAAATTVTERLLGGFTDGRPVYAYTLATPGGQRVDVINYGAALTHWTVPDAQGMAEVWRAWPIRSRGR